MCMRVMFVSTDVGSRERKIIINKKTFNIKIVIVKSPIIRLFCVRNNNK